MSYCQLRIRTSVTERRFVHYLCRVKWEVQKINIYSIDKEQGGIGDGPALFVQYFKR
jgi:hypothetical protein